jgi:hypothetical protein
MSIITCFKIATLLKPDVLHKLHTRGKKEKKKERGKNRGQAALSLDIMFGASQTHRKFMTKCNELHKACSGLSSAEKIRDKWF